MTSFYRSFLYFNGNIKEKGKKSVETRRNRGLNLNCAYFILVYWQNIQNDNTSIQMEAFICRFPNFISYQIPVYVVFIFLNSSISSLNAKCFILLLVSLTVRHNSVNKNFPIRTIFRQLSLDLFFNRFLTFALEIKLFM